MAIRVVLAEDNTLLREGIARLLERADGHRPGRHRGRPADAGGAHRGRVARPRRHRHPHAAHRHRRGHPDRGRAPRRAPGRGGGGAEPVRRPGLRAGAARRRLGGSGLPAEGAGERRRRPAGGDPGGRRRWLRDRLEGGRVARVDQAARGRPTSTGSRHGSARSSARWRRARATPPSPPRWCSPTRAVEKHTNSIFSKLGLSEEIDVNRRVKAVLLYLAAG